MLNITITKFSSMSLCVAVWLWCFSFSAFAQTASCNKPTVYYVNGVNTTLTAAHEGANELSVAIAEKFPQHGVTVRAIHNPSESLLSDLPEVAVTQHWLQVGIELILAVASITNPGLSAWLQKELDDVAAIFRRIDAIENIKKIVLAQIKVSSAPVILIAHSQGNIMVNEAVRQLKTNSGTANIPGVKTIAVLGIGVADRQNMPSLLANGENIDLYRYITSDQDLVLKPLQGILPPNFVISANRSFDISNHLLIGSYLSIENRGFRGSLQNLQPGSVDSRSVVVGLFDELYRNAAQAWPCFTLSSTPNPSVVGQEVVFSVTAKDRFSGKELAGQTVSLTFGDLTPPNLICSLTFDSFGNASCRQTFLAPARTEKVRIGYTPDALPGFVSDHYSQQILGGSYRFEVSEILPPYTSTYSCVSSGDPLGTLGFGAWSADRCTPRHNAVIRCVGTECVPGRFYASVSGGNLQQRVDCVIPGVQGCTSEVFQSLLLGEVDRVGANTFTTSNAEIYWYGLSNGNWRKVWPSNSPIGFQSDFFMNVVVTDASTATYQAKITTSHTLLVVFKVYDTLLGSYFEIPLVMNTP